MTIHQLSVFLENKPGTLDEILNILKAANIQIIASTISDTVEYGIYRIITSEPQKAFEALKAKNVSVNLSDVFAISLDNKVGKAADVIRLFTQAGINIEYLYSFLIKERGILIFRTNDPAKTSEIITFEKMNYIVENELINLC
ncbi:MAG: amino acid-binding protein [Bacteroidales bacterium]|nr:amino acid-binding protein [Bacteroidales bacterium]